MQSGLRDEGVGCFHQISQTGDGLLAFEDREIAEKGGDAFWFENLLATLDAVALWGEENVSASTIFAIFDSLDEGTALEAVEGEGHGGGGDPHVAGQIQDRHAFGKAQIVENRGLIGAYGGCLFSPGLARHMAG